MMKIDCIGCLHGNYPKLKGGDLLILTGDYTASDKIEQYTAFYYWLEKQKYKKKLMIAGNHDNHLQNDLDFDFPDEEIEYLEDSGIEFEGLKIWGSPWSPWFKQVNPKCKAFMEHDSLLESMWKLIPDNIDILITHSPPFGILDGIPIEDGSEFHVGSVSLRSTLENRIKPKFHIFSHIHEHGGKTLMYKRPGFGDENNTLCINASHVDENYKSVNQPVRI